MKTKYAIIAMLAALHLHTAAQNWSTLIPQNLKIEYMTNPQGLDEPRPRFSWTLVPVDSQSFAQKQTAYRIWVSDNENNLRRKIGNIWDSGWVESDQMQLITYKGKKLESDRTYFWTIAVKDGNNQQSTSRQIAKWSTGIFSPQEWSAKWIGSDQQFDPTQRDCNIDDPWLRKVFTLSEKPHRAVMFVASVGYHEVYVNGQRIGDGVLAPAVSNHTTRARYVAYDIAPYLKLRDNVIAIWLGASWAIFAPYATADKPRTPIVAAQVDIYNAEGKKLGRIETDKTWKTHGSNNKLLGSWEFGNYGGEIQDANREIKNWNKISLNDSKWQRATVYKPKLTLSAQRLEENRLVHEILPVQIQHTGHNEYRVDMGENFAGWTQINLHANPGDTIHLLFSEREQDQMTFNMRSQYVMGETGQGTFKNRFNYSSGRWITIKGATKAPTLDDIRGWIVRTDYEPTTTFKCSDPLQNWIYNRVMRTFENLSIGGYIVDCPQRERFGYGGDAHSTSETGMFNYKLGAFYTKWLQDWRDVQGYETMTGNMNDPEWARKQPGSGRYFGNGVLPHSAPTYHGGGGPAWGGIVVTLPWLLYQHYGDTRVLEQNFNAIVRWLDFLDTHTKNNLLNRYGEKWDFLGDWLWPGATAQGMNNDKPETVFFNNCYRVYNLRTAAKIARIIGYNADAKVWEQQAEASSRAIHAKFYNSDDHSYSDASMASLAAALYGNVMPSELRPQIIKRLEKEILENNNGHINVGITGGAMLFKVLRDEGLDHLIYSMTSQTDYPSWGYMRDNNATTIWEMWEKDLPGHSLLHSSYLYPGAWYIDGLAGIRRNDDTPGFRKFTVRIPQLTETQISWADASFDSPAGRIYTSWKRKNGYIDLTVNVPGNTSAIIMFPLESDNPVRSLTPYSTPAGQKSGYVCFEVGPGNHKFTNRAEEEL